MKYENRRFAPLAPRTSRKIFTSVLLSFVSVFTSVAKLQFRRSAFPYLPETKAANRSTGKFPADRYPRNAFGFSTPSTGRGLQTSHWWAAVSQSVFSQSAAAGAEHWVAPSHPMCLPICLPVDTITPSPYSLPATAAAATAATQFHLIAMNPA